MLPDSQPKFERGTSPTETNFLTISRQTMKVRTTQRRATVFNVFGLQGMKERKAVKKLQSGTLRSFYSPPNIIIRAIKPIRIKWAGHYFPRYVRSWNKGKKMEKKTEEQ
jgi:hypothetical protein